MNINKTIIRIFNYAFCIDDGGDWISGGHNGKSNYIRGARRSPGKEKER